MSEPTYPPAGAVHGEIAVDYGHSRDIQVVRCACGFECATVDEIVPHLQQHGVTAVLVTPENRRPR